MLASLILYVLLTAVAGLVLTYQLGAACKTALPAPITRYWITISVLLAAAVIMLSLNSTSCSLPEDTTSAFLKDLKPYLSLYGCVCGWLGFIGLAQLGILALFWLKREQRDLKNPVA